jgi:hypothetical protein
VKGLKVGEYTREILAESERINDLLAGKIVFDAAFVGAGNAQGHESAGGMKMIGGERHWHACA